MGGEGGDGARSLGFVWGGKISGVPGIKPGVSGCLEASCGTTIRRIKSDATRLRKLRDV